MRSANAMTRALVLLLALTGLLAIVLSVRAADAKVQGLYSNSENTASVEFQAGGKVHFSLSGPRGEGTYKINGQKLTLTIANESTEFTVTQDGSLVGPPGTYLSRLKKK